MGSSDFDELRRTQAALAASEARLKLVLKGANDGWWDWDLVADELFYSPRWWSMLGYVPGELAADAGLWRRLVHPEDIEPTERVLGKALAQGPDNYEVEFRLRHKAGHDVPVLSRGHILRDAQGKAVRVSGSNTDLTARRREEQALRDSELNLRSLLESMADGVFVAQDHRFVFANPALPALLGYHPQEFIGLPFEAVLAPESIEVWNQRFDARIGEGPEPLRRYETCFLTHEGERLWIDLRASRLQFAGRPGVLGIVRDLTEQRLAEATRMHLEARLREAQKMQAIGTLAGGIAHDFNNVLAAILGNLSIAQQDVEDGPAVGKSLERIDTAARHGRRVVQQILAFSRRDIVQPLQLSQPLRPIVEQSMSLLRATVPASVTLVGVLADPPLHVQVDSTQVQQVLVNLCTNAWHALNGAPGRIEIGLDEASAGASLPADLPAGRYAHLWVRDHGCGMNAAQQARIFEPFFTTKPIGEGTGLGLSVVHGIVTAHGGAITVESLPGIGSCFHVHLPLRPPPTATDDVLKLESATPGTGQRVVYIDDDEIMVLTVEPLLRRAGYEALGYQNARTAIDALIARPDLADIVVTDFNMPGLSGMDVARELARVLPRLPVVISSGYISMELRAEARSVGVSALMKKENTVEELAAVVHRVLSRPKR